MKYLFTFINLFFYVNSLYFHLYRNEKRCFYDEFYSELVVMVRYSLLDKNISFMQNSDKRIDITVSISEEKQIVHHYESGKLAGKFSLNIEKCN